MTRSQPFLTSDMLLIKSISYCTAGLAVFDYYDVVWDTLNDTALITALTQTRKKLQTKAEKIIDMISYTN